MKFQNTEQKKFLKMLEIFENTILIFDEYPVLEKHLVVFIKV